MKVAEKHEDMLKKRHNIYILAALLLLVSVGFLLLWARGNYTQKLLWKLGLEERPAITVQDSLPDDPAAKGLEAEAETEANDSLPVVIETQEPTEAPHSIEEPSGDYQRLVGAWNRNMAEQSADIVFLGDSITYRGNWSEYFPNQSVYNLGVGGDGVQHCLYRIKQVDTLTPKSVFLMCGINNIAAKNDIEDMIPYYETMLAHFKEMGYEVYVQSVLPVREPEKSDNATVYELNGRLAELSEEYDFPYVDLYSDYLDANGEMEERYVTGDGIHLNEEGYRIWVNEIMQYIMADEP